MDNVLDVTFREGSKSAITRSIYQHDYGVTLMFFGIELPESYIVHFSNDKESGIATAMRGNANGVKIPDIYIRTGKYIYAWIFIKDKKSGASTYSVTIPVIRRPEIYDDDITEDGLTHATIDVEGGTEIDGETLVFKS